MLLDNPSLLLCRRHCLRVPSSLQISTPLQRKLIFALFCLGYKPVVIIAVVKHPFFRYNETVRLDLFLKTARLVKRRVVAQSLCEAGRVLVNGREARSSREIRTGDRIAVHYAARTVDIEVLIVPERPGRMNSPDLYRVLSETRVSGGEEPWKRSPS
jgi:ribosomal 50S subunit-recycling heat shock protein